MAKVFVELRDKGTSFYDIEQGDGVVADRVAELEQTPKVREWLRYGQLLEVEEGDAKSRIKAQKSEQDKIAAKDKAAQNLINAEIRNAEKKQREELANLEKEAAHSRKVEEDAVKKLVPRYKELYEVDPDDKLTSQQIQNLIDTKEAEIKEKSNAAPSLDNLD